MRKVSALRVAFVLACLPLVAACGSEEGRPEQPAKEAPLQVVPYGQAIAAEGFQIGLISAKKKNQIGTPGMGPNAGSEEIFVATQVALKNLGAEPVSNVNFPKFELIDASGQPYMEDREATLIESMLSDSHSGDLNPGVTARLVSVWKVNKAAFDPKVWRIKVSFDQGASATVRKVARWPLETEFAPPLLLSLK